MFKNLIIIKIVSIILLFISLSSNGFSQGNKKDSINIYELSLEELLNIKVVTVSKSAENQSDAPGIITVLNKDEISRFGGTTLAAVLEQIPGLVGTTNYMSDRSIISMRGEQISANSNHVLLLINGRPAREMLEGGINSEMYESFPVNIIERMEIIKGPGSVLYGSNAFSGVINIITQKAEKTGASISAYGGNNGTFGTNADFKLKTSDLEIVVAARYLKKPDWELNYTVIEPNNPTPKTKDITIPNNGSGAFINVNYKNFSLISSYNTWVTSSFSSRGTIGDANWGKIFTNLGYKFNITSKWSSSINLGYTGSKLDVDSFPMNHRNSYELLGEWTNFVDFSKKAKLVFGGVISDMKGKEYNLLTGSKTYSSDGERFSYSGYVQLNYWCFSKLNLIGGIQLNKVKNIDLGIVPRAGIIYKPCEQISIKALYSEAYRAPSINELSLVNPALSGNLNLKPEKVATFDLSVNYFTKRSLITINYFNSKMTDIIIQNRKLANPMYDNVGIAYLQGLELETKFYINKSFYLFGSLLYQTSKDSANNSNIVPIANFSTKAGVSYTSDNGISASILDNFQGKLDDKYKSALNESPEKSYNRVNLHLDFNLNKLFSIDKKSNFNLYLHADNLFNKKVFLPLWGLALGRSVPYDLGRMVYIGGSIKF
jgi:outer membrane receptor for ferrienterochelin and colicins